MFAIKDIPKEYTFVIIVEPIPVGSLEWVEQHPDTENRPGWKAYAPDEDRITEKGYRNWSIFHCLPTYGFPGAGPGGRGFQQMYDLPEAIELSIENISKYPDSEQRSMLLSGLSSLSDFVLQHQEK